MPNQQSQQYPVMPQISLNTEGLATETPQNNGGTNKITIIILIILIIAIGAGTGIYFYLNKDNRSTSDTNQLTPTPITTPTPLTTPETFNDVDWDIQLTLADVWNAQKITAFIEHFPDFGTLEHIHLTRNTRSVYIIKANEQTQEAMNKLNATTVSENYAGTFSALTIAGEAAYRNQLWSQTNFDDTFAYRHMLTYYANNNELDNGSSDKSLTIGSNKYYILFYLPIQQGIDREDINAVAELYETDFQEVDRMILSMTVASNTLSTPTPTEVITTTPSATSTITITPTVQD